MENKTRKEERKEFLGSLEPVALTEQMIWSYGDWDLQHFKLTDIEIILTAPNRIAVKIHVRSNGTKTVNHPMLMVKIFDQDNQVIAEWTTKPIVINCNDYFIFADNAVLVSFYHRAFKAKLTMLGYSWKSC